jgi:hemolysin activation/secretion protein
MPRLMNLRFQPSLPSLLRCAGAFLALALAAHPVAAADAGDVSPKFDIMEYAVEGNTTLADIDIERAVMPHLGEDRTLQDVEAARSALEGAYRDTGYLTVVVSIPEQDVSAGLVTLSVLEGKVERLRVKGAEYHLTSDIKRKLPELAAGNVPHFPKVQREIDALNSSADLKGALVLKAGRAPGMVEVQMDVEDSLPVHGSVDLNNRQSANTTPTRLSGTVRYDNLWQARHSASLTLQTSPEKTDEVRTAAATYVAPIDARGNALVLYSVFSRSKLASLSGSPGLGLLGNSNIYGARYAMALPSDDSFGQALSVGFDYKDVKQSVVVAGSAELPTPITYTPLVVAYNGNWMGNGRTTGLAATATYGVRGLFGNHDEEFAAKRSGASASFFTLRTSVEHTEIIQRWALSGKLELQLASGPLVSNEQFAAGGAESVRGYLEGERVGDQGLRWALELRTPKINFLKNASPIGLTGLAFFEGVKLRTLQPVYPQPSTQALQSAGLGLRLTASHGLSFAFDLAYAMNDADLTRSGDTRVHSRLLLDF